MGTKMKGMFKGFNKKITHIFVVKEREIEIEIGGPTDVKHVGHIGWDGSAGTSTAPSWMGDFKTGPEFASSSIGRTNGSAVTSLQTIKACEVSTEASTAAPKKHRRRKHRKSSSAPAATTSPSTGGGSSSTTKKKSKTKLRKSKAKETKAEGDS